MELEGLAASRDDGNGRLMQRNKISSMKNIALVARELGEDEEWLWDMVVEMEPEDGVIRVYGLDDDTTVAFSEEGVEALQNLIEMHRENEKLIDPRSLT
jgi:hypothetical protein